MAGMLNIPVLGLVENMSYALCPDCGKKIPLFGEGLDEAAAQMGVPVLAKLPLNADIARLCDSGEIERVVCEEMDGAADAVEAREITGTGKSPRLVLGAGGLPRSGCSAQGGRGAGGYTGGKMDRRVGGWCRPPRQRETSARNRASCKGIWHDNSRFA